MTLRSLMPLTAMLLAVAMLLPVRPAHAATSYDGCAGFVDALPATITTQGVWCLRQDLATAATSGVALTIAANNVTLDCHGFRLAGQAGSSSELWGIYAASRQNITVRDCDIRRFRIGLELRFGGGHAVEDNRLDGNLQAAIMLRSITGGRISGNRVDDTGGAADDIAYIGIHCRAINGGACAVLDNIVSCVVGSTGRDNPVTGIQVSGSLGGRVAENTVRRLFPSGLGTATGIDASLSAGKYLHLDGNRLDLGTASPGSIAIDCGEEDWIYLRDNVAWGFEAGFPGCWDEGTNDVH